MRGTAESKGFAIVAVGITPAHAGNSPRGLIFQFQTKDHPRTCGEQCVPVSSLDTHIGSPPHMRGTAELVFHILVLMGITPAHAGNRCLQRTCTCGDQDHPRTCGEQILRVSVITPSLGSPPHMRGTVFYKEK